jgi:hypothetical protein
MMAVPIADPKRLVIVGATGTLDDALAALNELR